LVKRTAFVIAVFCFADSFAVRFYFVNFAYIRFPVVDYYWRLLWGVLGAKSVLSENNPHPQRHNHFSRKQGGLPTLRSAHFI
jgi:hypothetical protein